MRGNNPDIVFASRRNYGKYPALCSFTQVEVAPFSVPELIAQIDGIVLENLLRFLWQDGVLGNVIYVSCVPDKHFSAF